MRFFFVISFSVFTMSLFAFTSTFEIEARCSDEYMGQRMAEVESIAGCIEDAATYNAVYESIAENEC